MGKTAFKTTEGESKFFDAYHNTLTLWKVPYESLYVDTEYGVTHILVSGPKDGEPIILLHGFGFGAPMWYPNVEVLSKENRVYAVDVIGEFNKSVITKSFKEKVEYANWLNEVLDKLHISKATFVGHSNGGWHILNFANHSPMRVKKMVLLAPAASVTSFSIQFPIRLLIANIIRTRSVIINFFARWFVAKGNTVHDYLFEQFYQGLMNFKWEYKIIIPSVFKENDLKKLDIPTLFLVGDKEIIYNHKKALTKAKKNLPNLQTVLISGSGHALSIERADVVNEHMMKFIHS